MGDSGLSLRRTLDVALAGSKYGVILENPVKDAADGCHNPRWIVAAPMEPTPLDEGLTSRRIASTERSALWRSLESPDVVE